MQVNISHSLLCDPCAGKPPFCNPVGPTRNLYYQSINMRALLYSPSAESKFTCQVSFSTWECFLAYKRSPSCETCCPFAWEHQFSGGCKVKQACKITLQAFANTLPTQSTESPSKASTLIGCIYVRKPGTSRKPPITARLLCQSLTQVWL